MSPRLLISTFGIAVSIAFLIVSVTSLTALSCFDLGKLLRCTAHGLRRLLTFSSLLFYNYSPVQAACCLSWYQVVQLGGQTGSQEFPGLRANSQSMWQTVRYWQRRGLGSTYSLCGRVLELLNARALDFRHFDRIRTIYTGRIHTGFWWWYSKIRVSRWSPLRW